MKEKRLLNELGNVNDEFIEQAKPKIKRNRKKLYAAIGSVAAAAAVFVTIFALGNHIPGNDTIPTDSSNAVEEITSGTIAEAPLTFEEVKCLRSALIRAEAEMNSAIFTEFPKPNSA